MNHSVSVWKIYQYNLFNQSRKLTDKVKHVLHVRLEISIICHRANIANCSLIVWSTIMVFIFLTRIIITVGLQSVLIIVIIPLTEWLDLNILFPRNEN